MRIIRTDFSVYEGALVFYEAYAVLMGKYSEAREHGNSEGNVLLIPAMVNGCLSAELFLKSLLVDYDKKHFLYQLTKVLYEKDKEAYVFVKRFTTTDMREKGFVNYTDELFDNDLKQFDNAFCEWRYFFEYNEKAQEKVYNYEFLSSFLIALKSLCALYQFPVN